MRPKQYPLDPLDQLRTKEVDEAVALLAEATLGRQEAERIEAAAHTQRDAAAARTVRVLKHEQTALERGELRSVDLALAAAWRARDAAERAELERRLERATEAKELATAKERIALDAVARTRAQAEVVTRDREKWDAGERKREGAAEEEAAAEAFREGPT